MNMPKITVAVGVLLLAQGLGFYFAADSRSVTALIPAFVGLPILVLGAIAMQPAARKHAMHAAAALAALGLAAAIGRMATAGLSVSLAGISVMILALITGGYVIVCAKSFVDARRRPDQVE